MAISFEGETEAFTSALEKINYIFTSVFIIECTLKLIG